MATKRECDRCHNQWHVDSEEDKLTATISFVIPRDKDSPPRPTNLGWTENPKIEELHHYCQECSREIYAFALGHDTQFNKEQKLGINEVEF